jgi:hypothetical protein
MEEEMRRVCVSMNVRKKDPHVPSASKDFLDLRASKEANVNETLEMECEPNFKMQWRSD